MLVFFMLMYVSSMFITISKGSLDFYFCDATIDNNNNIENYTIVWTNEELFCYRVGNFN